jgi:hypothetical protein
MTVSQDTKVSFRLISDAGTREECNVPLSVVRERLGDAVADALAAKCAQGAVNTEAQAYLAATDWYLVRNGETGADVPDAVLAERAAKRAAIVPVDWDVTA